MVSKIINKKILVVGCGYVGLVTGVGLAELGHHVSCYDINPERVAQLQKGKTPYYEPGLPELLLNNLENHHISIHDTFEKAYSGQRYIIVAVQTPLNENNKADMSSLYAAVTTIANAVIKPTLVIVKSTVPVGIFDKLQKLPAVKKNGKLTFVSCPEFLSEGDAIRGFFHPVRTVVGSEKDSYSEEVAGLFYGVGGQYVLTDARTAQMIKYTSNAFLATRVAFINDIAQLCEKLDVNARNVSKALTMDPRLGNSHLMPGMAFDGPCLPKDIAALIETSENVGLPALLLRGVNEHNHDHLDHIIESAMLLLGNKKTIALFGLSFKPNTDDVRNAYSLKIINSLIERGAVIRATDPHSIQSAISVIAPNKSLSFFQDPYEAAKGSELQLFLNPWDEFKAIDLQILASKVKRKLIYDVMHMIDHQEAQKHEFDYYAVGNHLNKVALSNFTIFANSETKS